MSTHHLLVELEPDSDPEDREYTYSVECSGADRSCIAWQECRQPHSDLSEYARDRGEGISHGVEHQVVTGIWMINTNRCGLYAFPDAWVDSGSDLAHQLGPGKHEIDFDWYDEYSISVSHVPPKVDP